MALKQHATGNAILEYLAIVAAIAVGMTLLSGWTRTETENLLNTAIGHIPRSR